MLAQIVRALAVPVLAVGALIAGVLPAAAAEAPSPGQWLTVEEMGFDQPTPSQSQKAITTFGQGRIVVFVPEGSIEELQTVDEEEGEKVISLSTDILFTPDEWTLPSSAQKKIEDLLTDVPDGTDLAVHGHTDSVKGAIDNEELSERRAESVADVVASVRPDLNLDIQGFADSRPKEAESGDDDTEARAANRRVELRYG